MFTVTKTKVIADDGSFSIGISHWGIFYTDTQENLQCIFWINNYKLENPQRRLFFIGTRKIFPMRNPFIEIYGESQTIIMQIKLYNAS